MAKSDRVFPRKAQSPPPLEQQLQIVDQTAAFLAKGGAIQQIPNGVSGQPKLGGPSFTITGAPIKAPS